jgi:hypothetical protein
LISVKHPEEKCNISQAEFLANCPADQRRFHELLFSYGNSAYLYHQQGKDFEPSKHDFEEWLEGLPENVRREMQHKDSNHAKTCFLLLVILWRKMMWAWLNLSTDAFNSHSFSVNSSYILNIYTQECAIKDILY